MKGEITTIYEKKKKNQNLKPGSHEKKIHLKEQTNFQTNVIADLSINYFG